MDKGEIVFKVWERDSLSTVYTKEFVGFEAINSEAENTVAYIDYIANGKMQASDLSFAYGRGLLGAGEVSYWLKGDTRYSLVLDNSLITSSYRVSNESLNTLYSTFLLNETSNL
ncbi:MAG: hypothetical protein ACTSSM_16615, partial [Promethearchaeota archaeon]